MNTKQPRFLITRLSHIGDCVLTLPMVNQIRARYPEAFIAWAVESPSHKLLRLNPSVDQLIMIPKGWMGRIKNWFELRRELRSYRFDCAIDPQGITKSAMLGWLSGARHRVGVRGQWGRELSPYLNNRLVQTDATHLVDRSLALVAKLIPLISITDTPQAAISKDADVPKRHLSTDLFAMQPGDGAQRFIQDFVQNESISTEPIVVINPGASWASKRWVNDRFADVAVFLAESHKVKPVISWAGEEELKMAKRIVAQSAGRAALAPPTTLEQLAALCKRADGFIGCDTGPLHIAAAVGTPCVGLYGPTRPRDSGAYGPQHVAVQAWYQAGSCRERRSADNLAMKDITVADVCVACEQLFARDRRDHRAA